ncbi:MAG TPA: efflux RND transporter periplasmic adaptor subunit, partial [Steroidobacteraceae bacterium]|nr:efflux RND transporter periplasmic adaptor subunit [Steroidobacteraceae bacterium]
MKASIGTASIAAAIASLLSACSHDAPPTEALRPVRTVEVQYEAAHEVSRYFGSVQARHEVDQAFRVGGKVLERRVDVGQSVHDGDVLAVLDDVDYRLSEEAARQQLQAATAKARQAESDWQRLQALKHDGSVSDFDEEHAQSTLLTARAAAEAEARKLELARNQVKYAVLRASSSGVVTSVRLEVGQVVAEGQPVVQIANQGEPEIVADVPEDQLEAF